MEKAADQGEDARVISVFSAGKGGAIDLDDLDVKNVSGTMSTIARKASVSGTYNDLIVEVLPLLFYSILIAYF